MAIPVTRQEFADLCLRKLGDPVIDINVANSQIDDRIDEALSFYADYHFDSTELTYVKHLIDANTVATQAVQMPDNIIGVTKVFEVGDPSSGGGDIFNIRYQIALNDLYTLTNTSMIPYYMSMQQLALIQEMLVGKTPIRFNRHMNIVYVDKMKASLDEGSYLLFECYRVVSGEDYPNVWKDRWLQNYATALIKRQWGSNITKFSGLQLPGGVQFNGEKIYDDATNEIQRMEEEMLDKYSLPPMFEVG